VVEERTTEAQRKQKNLLRAARIADALQSLQAACLAGWHRFSR